LIFEDINARKQHVCHHSDTTVFTVLPVWLRRATRRGRVMSNGDFAFGKAKPMLPSLHVAQQSPPFAAPGRLFEPPGRLTGRKNLERDLVGFFQ